MTSSRNSYSEFFYCYVRRHIWHHLRDWWVDEAEWIGDDEQPEQLLGNFFIVMCDDTYCII